MTTEEKKGRRCVVDICTNEGTHLFPKDEFRKLQWIQAIIHFKPGVTIRKYSRICLAHFKPNDFNRSPLSVLHPNVAPKTLKKTAVPSIFPWKTDPQELPKITSEDQNASLPCTTPSEPSEHQDSLFLNFPAVRKAEPSVTSDDQNTSSSCTTPPKRSEDQDSLFLNFPAIGKTYSRTPPILFVEAQPFLNTLPCESSEDPLKCDIEDTDSDHEQCSQAQEYANNNTEEMGQLDIAEDLEIAQTEEIFDEKLGNREHHEKYIQTEDNSINVEKHEKSVQTVHNFTQSIHYYKNNDKAIHFYTGLENFKKLMLVFQTLGQCVNNLNYFYGRPPKRVDPLEQFFITLLILRRHKPFEEIAMMFGITVKQVYNIFITWIRFMSLQWKSLDLWLDKESVTAYMPLDFFDKFPSTRVVLDATECPIKKPKLPFAQQVTFSSYKNRNTVKFLIGITPSGLISYVSPCFGGSATDRQIIERSPILNKFDYNDEIMVDKGLNVQDIFMPYGVKVNMPSFFKKGNQIGPQTLLSNRKVASKRVHVERVIGLLKTYKILSQPLNQTETMLSSDIVFICAMLANFRSNIINKNA